MNYYKEIKKELIENEIYKKVKEYSINRSDLQTYYNVGKLLMRHKVERKELNMEMVLLKSMPKS